MEQWDKKEEDIFKSLTKSWEEYIAPGVVEKGLQKVSKNVSKIIPVNIQKKMPEYIDKAMSSEVIQKVLTMSTKGFWGLGKNLARYTLSKQRIEKAVNKRTGRDCIFDFLTEFKSYELEKGVVDNKIRKQFSAL